MTKKDEEQASAAAQPAPLEGPTMLVRKGRYVGPNGRAFDSVPFGERFVVRTGLVYEVRESFKYLWVDAAFASVWEWQGEPYLAAAVNEGQVPAK